MSWIVACPVYTHLRFGCFTYCIIAFVYSMHVCLVFSIYSLRLVCDMSLCFPGNIHLFSTIFALVSTVLE